MRFINAWSYALANGLTKQLKQNNGKRQVYYYGFQIIVGTLFKGALLVGISAAAGSLAPALAIFFFFSALKVLAGGYHMDTYGKCLATSLAIYILAGIFVRYTYPFWGRLALAAFTLLILIIGLLTVSKWAPADTPNKRITDPDDRKKFKRLSIIELFLWSLFNIILIVSGHRVLSLSGCIGVLIAVLNITPAAYKFFNMISGKVDKLKL